LTADELDQVCRVLDLFDRAPTLAPELAEKVREEAVAMLRALLPPLPGRWGMIAGRLFAVAGDGPEIGALRARLVERWFDAEVDLFRAIGRARLAALRGARTEALEALEAGREALHQLAAAVGLGAEPIAVEHVSQRTRSAAAG
jgi:hypothetical protein